jgi:hypothetical protein
MAAVNVSAQTDISAEPTDIASVMFDPQREPEWVSSVTSVELVDRAIKPGARVRRTGRVAGRDLTWTTAVETFHFPHALTLRVTDGPIDGTISYVIQRSAAGGSTVKIQTRGEATALGALPGALIEGPIRTTLEGDLARLKQIVEQR